MDATDDVSVSSDINLESFQAVTSYVAKTQVNLRQIMEHISLSVDGVQTGNNSKNNSGASSETNGKIM